MTISDEALKQLRKLSVEQVAEALGIVVKHHSALCFIHEDHHPSLVFSPRYNTWRCFACGEKGDVISLVEKKLNLSFIDACKWLASEYGINLEDNAPITKGINTPLLGRKKAENAESEFTSDAEILQHVLSVSTLTPLARRFLFKERAYTREAVTSAGVKSIRWGKELADSIVAKFGEERALKSGLVIRKKDSFFSYFHSPSLLFPYFSRDGQLLGIQARYLGKVEQYPRFQFTRGQRVPIFNLPILNTIQEGDELYVSEGVTDCLALLSEGKKAVAIPSATLLKSKDLLLLSKYRLMMYPDNDEPGERLFTQIQDGVTAYGGTIHRLILPEGVKDYSEYHIRHKAYSRPTFESGLLHEDRRKCKKTASRRKKKSTLDTKRHICIAEINAIDELQVDSIIAELPSWRAEKALAFKHLQGRKESALSFHLLQKVLREEFGIAEEIAFEYNEHGKPSLKNHPEVYFNISHCKNAVACAVSEKPIGIDVEMLGRYKESLARYVLNDEEFNAVQASENPDLKFTILWTKKEAVLKLVGTGVSNNMKNVLVEYGDKKITTTVCDGYVYSVAE